MASNQGAKFTLHWLERSRAQRIMWIMEELNLSYEIKTYKRSAMGTAPPELKRVHPLGKSPLLEVHPPSAQAITLAESGPIMEYLLDHYSDGKLAPRKFVTGKENQVGGETESWLRYRYFMHYAEGSLMSPIQVQLIMNALKGPAVPFYVRPITGLVATKLGTEFLDEEIKTHFDFLEQQLGSAPDGGPFLCGSDPTAADIQMSIPIIIAFTQQIIDKNQYPALDKYAQRLQTSTGYQKAVQRIEEIQGTKVVPI